MLTEFRRFRTLFCQSSLKDQFTQITKIYHICYFFPDWTPVLIEAVQSSVMDWHNYHAMCPILYYILTVYSRYCIVYLDIASMQEVIYFLFFHHLSGAVSPPFTMYFPLLAGVRSNHYFFLCIASWANNEHQQCT